jgi:hypothetical protein
MNQAPKQPNIFGQVLAAILVAAAIGGIIFGIYWLHSEGEATRKAEDNLQNEIGRADTLLRLLKSPSPSRPANFREVTPSRPAELPTEVTLTKAIPFEVKYGRVTLYPGTKLEFVGRNGDRVRVRYEGADYDIEISATDLVAVP